LNDYEKSISLYDDGLGSVAYVDHLGSDLTIVNAARVSFGNEKTELDAKDKRLINYLIRHRHTSTLEHNVVTFKFVVPLFVRSQHHRHRTWSYNEISRRYTDKNLRFYEPKHFRTQHKSNRQASNESDLINPLMERYDPSCAVPFRIHAANMVRDHHAATLKLFDDLMDAGVCREQARGILPQNLYTEYYGTCNLNNLVKFIDLRMHEGAQWEIQQVAKACLEIATDLFPVAVSSYRDIRYGDQNTTKEDQL
jgi:thymidylate synthase (FAD)